MVGEFHKVLNKGFVRLIESMGDDMSVVRSARVSYGNETKGEEADKKLINYLMKHNHGTPFEHLNFTFHVKAPIFIARQWFRHRIGSFNEISGRYVKLDLDFWSPNEWRINDQKNLQSSSFKELSPEEVANLNSSLEHTYNHISVTYDYLIAQGVAREQARAILPVATYTEFYWTVNARSLFNFIKLRTHESAQKEMQDYGNIIYDIVKETAPWTFDAFEKHILS